MGTSKLKGHRWMYPVGSSRNGWVVGTAYDHESESYTTWVYTPGTAGPAPLAGAAKGFYPGGVNSNGVVVGEYQRAPYTWSPRSEQPLRPLPLPSNATGGAARDINEYGTIVGRVVVGGVNIAYRWNPDGTHGFLPNPQIVGIASYINDAGQILGEVGSGQPILWSQSGWELLPITGRIGGISNDGVIVGIRDVPEHGYDYEKPRVFVYRDGDEFLLLHPYHSLNPYKPWLHTVVIDACGNVGALGEDSVGYDDAYIWPRDGC